jgi:hypothetical protein
MKFISQFFGLLLFPLLHLTSCAQDAFPTLIGKYKLRSTTSDERMLEIGKDSVMAIYSMAGGPKLRLKILEVGNEMLTVMPIQEQGSNQVSATGNEQQEQTGIGIQKTVPEPKVSQWQYTLTDGLLTIQNDKTGKKEVAMNCQTGGCDFQKEYFRLSQVDVDLPYDSAHQYEAFPIQDGARSFYYGPRQPQYTTIYGSGSAIFVNETFIKPHFFSYELLYKPLPILASELKVIGFIDRKTEMNDLKTLLAHLANDGIHEIYLAVRENANVSQPLQVRLAKMEFKSLENVALKGSVGDWINGKK